MVREKGNSGRRAAVSRLIGLFAVLAAVLMPGAVQAAGDRLVVGVHPYLPATRLELMYAPLTAYLSSVAEKAVALNVAKDYGEHITMIGEDRLDVALLDPASYVDMVDRYGHKPLLARFEVARVPTFYGVIIVADQSPIQVLKHLKGKRFAFADRQSATGHLIPRFMFGKAGVSLEDFSEYVYMSNHENVALGVLFGDYDAGAVKQDVYDKYENRGLRILAVTPPVSEHLFVASGALPAAEVDALRDGLQRLKNDTVGGTIMRAMKPTLTALVPVVDEDYDNLRTILHELKESGAGP